MSFVVFHPQLLNLVGGAPRKQNRKQHPKTARFDLGAVDVTSQDTCPRKNVKQSKSCKVRFRVAPDVSRGDPSFFHLLTLHFVGSLDYMLNSTTTYPRKSNIDTKNDGF